MKKQGKYEFRSCKNLEVVMTPISEILDKETIEKIINKNYYKFMQCQYNALQVSLLKDDINYCEGYADGIIHSWCERNGRYFDPTYELNGMDVSDMKYELVRVFPSINAGFLFAAIGETTTTFIKYIETKKGKFIFNDDCTLFKVGKSDKVDEQLFQLAQQRLSKPMIAQTPTDEIYDFLKNF